LDVPSTAMARVRELSFEAAPLNPTTRMLTGAVHAGPRRVCRSAAVSAIVAAVFAPIVAAVHTVGHDCRGANHRSGSGHRPADDAASCTSRSKRHVNLLHSSASSAARDAKIA
jgi:hypothetical protein